MKSLDDLELEKESGGIDDESYAALHDDYTARLAATLRSLRDDIDVTPEEAPTSEGQVKRRTRKRVALVAAVVVFAILAGVSLAYAVGARLPGQMGSGDSQATSSTLSAARQGDPRQAQEDDHGSAGQGQRFSRRLRPAPPVVAGLRAERRPAQRAEAVGRRDRHRPQPSRGPRDLARLLYLISGQLPAKAAQQQYVAQALAGFNKAIEVDPNYADSYFFRAVLYYGALQDFARAQVDLQNYLVKDPAGRWADKARSLLDAATKAMESPATTTVPPTTTTKKK